MKYIAIQLLGRNEMNGIVVQADDFDKLYPIEVIESDDPSQLARGLYNYLSRCGYIADHNGVIHVTAFGVVRISLLVGMITLFRYVEFDGGIHNPNLLGWVKGDELPYRPGSERVEEVVKMVRGHFKGRRKSKNVLQEAK